MLKGIYKIMRWAVGVCLGPIMWCRIVGTKKQLHVEFV